MGEMTEPVPDDEAALLPGDLDEPPAEDVRPSEVAVNTGEGGEDNE